MREIVHGVDDPVVPRAVVGRLQDAVQDGVTEVEVGRGHVDFRPEHPAALFEFSSTHAQEEVEVFIDGTIPVGALPARLGEGAPVVPDLVKGKVIHIGLAIADEVDGHLVEMLEVVGCVEQVVAPVPTQPTDIFQDGVDVLHLLPGRVGVVEAHVAVPAVLGGQPEVEAGGLGVANVEIAVGFGREPGDNIAAELSGAIVFGNDGADEVGAGGCL